jgi:hypothetical protein
LITVYQRGSDACSVRCHLAWFWRPPLATLALIHNEYTAQYVLK